MKAKEREKEGALMRERVCVPHMHKHARAHTHAQAHTCIFTHMHTRKGTHQLRHLELGGL